jgi:hypothetical protein
MGVRFHKSIPLLPFVRLNFSKSGVSFSLGAPGASLNLGAKGARGSVGLPGTGLSYRKSLGKGRGKGKTGSRNGMADARDDTGGSPGTGGVILKVILVCLLFGLGVYVYSLL